MSPIPTLGIDVGTTNTKVVLAEVGATGIAIRAVSGAPTPRPDCLAGALSALVRDVLADGPAPLAVGIASMAETGVPLARDDTPVGDWLRWDGHRAGAEADALARTLGWAELVAATGVRPGAKVPLATWAWLRDHDPERFAAMARWAGAADLAGLLLTGRLATDHTLAGRTMAYRLPAPGAALPEAFDADLLAAVGLRPGQLPAVVPAGLTGAVTAPAFLAAGLRAGTPVSIAGHDHAVGAYAAGARRPGQVADSVGTAEALLSVVDVAPDPVAVGRTGMSSVVTVDGRHRALLAGSPGAGAVVQWFLDTEVGGEPADRVFADVLASGDGPGEILVLPYLHGRQTPAPDPAARMRLLGRRPEHTPAQLAQGVLEGLCLQARWIYEQQTRLAGSVGSTDPIAVLGGPLAANPAWLHLKALIMPRPLRQVTEAEAVAAGAALVGAVRAGLLDPAGIQLDQQPVPVPPGARPDYDPTFAAFVAAATGVPA